MNGEATPILLTRAQLRALASHGELEIRVPARPGPTCLPNRSIEALSRRYPVGQCLWGREVFATRADGDRLFAKICYPAAGPGGQCRLVPIDQVQAKYLTDRYVTRPAKYMPRWASRILLEVTATRPESQATHFSQDVLVIRARLCESAPPAAGVDWLGVDENAGAIGGTDAGDETAKALRPVGSNQ
jgi:hypothetical protein